MPVSVAGEKHRSRQLLVHRLRPRVRRGGVAGTPNEKDWWCAVRGEWPGLPRRLHGTVGAREVRILRRGPEQGRGFRERRTKSVVRRNFAWPRTVQTIGREVGVAFVVVGTVDVSSEVEIGQAEEGGPVAV